MVRSTFGAFTTAYSGLLASQKGLEVTGHNIANVNTPGYSRQRLDLFSRASGGFYTLYSQGMRNNIGHGVGIGGITQIRDKTLDVRFRDQVCDLGEAEASCGALDDLAIIFDKIAINGLEGGFQDFIGRLNDLANNPELPGFDDLTRVSAENLTKMFNDYSRQINDILGDQKYMLKDISMSEINGILENISRLNQNIMSDQIAGNPALELKDKRNELLDELAQYMQIDVNYTSEKLSNGFSIENIKINLRGTDVTLIDNKDAVQLEYSEDADGLAQISIVGGADITDKITSGSVRGLLDMINDRGVFGGVPGSTRGIGYYAAAFDNLVEEFANAFNNANKSPVYDYSDPENPVLIREDDHPLFVSRDGGPITASNIAVAPDWLNHVYGITFTKQPAPPIAPGATDEAEGLQDNVIKMIALFDETFNFTSGTGTFLGFFQQLGNEADAALNAKRTLMDNYYTVTSGISDLREGISSVSLDEEAINLLRYEKSYNAAARLMTILDEAVDTIINRMGIVGR